jgi:succinylglutamate desuccinylase
MRISKDPNIEGVVHITADPNGPRVVMFSGVHGDEVSGVHAIEKLFFDLFGGERSLVRGSLILARANKHALTAERRYIKHNLNRLFREEYGTKIDRDSYEFKRAQELKTILHNCDYFLDFHSAPIAQEPFLVAEQGSIEFFRKLGISRIITGWSKFSGGAIGGDAENYANTQGAKAATLESGSHFERQSIGVAYRTACSLLSVLGMIVGAEQQGQVGIDVFDVYGVITKDSDDFRYAGHVTNFQFFKKGKPFAFQCGHEVTVSEDTYLLIPMKPEDTKLREEVCYLGRKLAV